MACYQLAPFQKQAKARDAAVFAKATRSSSGNMMMGVAPHLLAGEARARDSLLSAGFISAANLTMGRSSAMCAVLAASHRTMEVWGAFYGGCHVHPQW